MLLEKRTDLRLRQRHVGAECVDQVVAVLERARLRTVAENRDVLAVQGLHDEVGDDSAVLRMHPRPVRVEDAHHARIDVTRADRIRNQRLRDTLALVVAAADADRIDVAPVVLFLWMHDRVAIDLARRAVQHLRAVALRQLQAQQRAPDRGHSRQERLRLIMHRARRTRQVVDLVKLRLKSRVSRPQVGYIGLDEREVLVLREAPHVRARPRIEVVNRDDPIALIQKPLTEVTSKKARSARY